MKTLDEVIKAFEICIGYYCSNAEHDVCPYFGESDMGCMKEPEKDALHYLRAFRDAKDTLEREKDRYAEAVKNCELAENKYRKLWKETSQNSADTSQITCPQCHSEFVILPESNDPLTWDELRTMEGKPVWVENVFGLAEWELIANVKEDNIYTIAADEVGADIPKEDYPHRWQAYRKERA